MESRTASQQLKHRLLFRERERERRPEAWVQETLPERLLFTLHAALQVGAAGAMLKTGTSASAASALSPDSTAQAPCRGAIPSLGEALRFDGAAGALRRHNNAQEKWQPNISSWSQA